MKTNITDNKAVIYLQGRIDSTNAPEKEMDIMGIIQENSGKGIEFDMSELEYISSAGLRILMKVKKIVKDEVVLSEVSSDIYEILETTGFTDIFTVKKRMREVSVEGLEIIGTGFYGTVYRIDADTIIKVYDSADAIGLIENEKKMARLAFLSGVPTAISFDIVKVGDSYGSVFELLNAKTFNDLIIESPEKNDEIIKQYVSLMKCMHGTEIQHGEVPSAKMKFLGFLDVLHDYLGDELYNRLKTLFNDLEDPDTLIHGDIQMKNVMMVHDEPMLIDMDTLAAGKPIFDLAGIYVTYQAFEEDDKDNSMAFLGISNEMCNTIWNKTLRYYYDTDDEDELNKLSDKIRIAAYVRFLNIICESSLKDGTLGETRIKHAIEHLNELTDRVDSLN